jgi:hypothetical protein
MTDQRTGRVNGGMSGAGFLALLILAVAAPASAQSIEPDGRWQAWLGCWAPSDAPPGAEQAASGVPVVCVLPTPDAAAVELATVAEGEVVARERLVVSGQRPSGDEGCTGWESASWSPDGRRVYREAEHTCAGDVASHATALMTILPSGEWLDVQGVTVSGYTGVRVVRYGAVSDPESLPAEVRTARPGSTRAVEAARIAAAAPLTAADVIESSRHLAPEVIEAWLVEREQGFAIDARQLVELADAGVPGRVTDLMVALSYPRVFAIDRAAREGEFRPVEGTVRSEYLRPGVSLGLSPWRYQRHPYGYGYGYGAGGYGYGYDPRFGYRYGGYPVVIVVRGSEDVEASPPARAVKGRGYTRGGSSRGAAPASPPSTSTGAARPTSSPPEASSGRSGSASSGSDSAQPTRRAKPRDPDE